MRRLARALRARRHTVRETALHRISPEGKAQAEQFEPLMLHNCDVLLTSSTVRTRSTRRAAMEHGVTTVAFVHSALSIDKRLQADLVVWGSESLKEYYYWELLGPVGEWLEHTMYPLVFPEDVAVQERLDDRITLINLAPAKGGRLFRAIAEAAPDLQFLGVKGWGEQHSPPGGWPSNVQIVNWMPDPRNIYERTKILLFMKGEGAGKGWLNGVGLTAIEASVSGIPTIAHAGPGLKESLGKWATYCEGFTTEEWLTAIRSTLSLYSHYSERAKQIPHAWTSESRVDKFLSVLEEIL